MQAALRLKPLISTAFTNCRRSRIQRAKAIVTRASSSSSSGQARGGLPRFFSQQLPQAKGNVIRVQGDEFRHMTKVLRMNIDDRLELFNGAGGIAEGCILKIDKTGVDFMALEEPRIYVLEGTQWHIYAAFGTLKGDRTDWLIEKCTELGASSVTPLITDRSLSISENRVDRWRRVAEAAMKQCQRLQIMELKPPVKVHDILPLVGQTKLSLLAAADANPLLHTLSNSRVDSSGILIVGPEGDFTQKELDVLTEAGAVRVGLGPCRLRVETATVALLATAMLWADAGIRTCDT